MSEESRMAFRKEFTNSRKKRDQILGNLIPLLVENALDNENIYHQLYPEKPFSEKQYRNLRSELFQRLTDFLAIQSFMASPEKKLFLARTMNQMQATRHFPAIIEKYSRQEDGIALSLEGKDLNNRLKAEIIHHQVAVHGRKSISLNDLILSSEEAFVARILYYALAHFEVQHMYDNPETEPPLLLWDGIIQQLEAGAWGDSKLIQVYYALFKLVKSPGEAAHYLGVKKILTAYGHFFEKTEAKEMYTVALNYCVKVMNSGESSFTGETFHLYKEMLDRSLLITENGIEAWHFKSIATLAINLGDFSWTKDFMDKYARYLSPQFRSNSLFYCKGVLDFHTKDYRNAELHMNEVLQDYNDPFFGLDARAYLLKIYYETGNVTGMDALANSFRLFLRRHQHLSTDRLQNYHEFIRFFRRLVALPKGKLSRAEKLKKEISSSPYHAGREWLLEKLEQN